MFAQDDILQPLTNTTDLYKLRNIYQNLQPSTSHIYNYLSNVIRRLSLEPDSNYFTILLPEQGFESGTFVGIEEGVVLIYTLEEDCKTLMKALKETKKIDWKKPWIIYCVLEKHYLSVIDILEEHGFECKMKHSCGVWWIRKEEATNLSISCPDDVYIAPLEVSHASTINTYWLVRSDSSVKYLENIIKFGGGYGVFLKSNGLLVSWALHNPIGIGNIQTIPEYMRKRYGTLIGKYISKTIGERGCDSIATILENNVASETMFAKIGFQHIGKVLYLFGKGSVPDN